MFSRLPDLKYSIPSPARSPAKMTLASRLNPLTLSNDLLSLNDIYS